MEISNKFIILLILWFFLYLYVLDIMKDFSIQEFFQKKLGFDKISFNHTLIDLVTNYTHTATAAITSSWVLLANSIPVIFI